MLQKMDLKLWADPQLLQNRGGVVMIIWPPEKKFEHEATEKLNEKNSVVITAFTTKDEKEKKEKEEETK